MPLIVIRLHRNSSGTNETVQLPFPIIPQAIRLLSYRIELNVVDSNLKSMYVELPFLKSDHHVLSNVPHTGFPLQHDPEKSMSWGKADYIFRVSDTVSRKITDWKVYDQTDSEYTSEYTVELVFHYERPYR